MRASCPKFQTRLPAAYKNYNIFPVPMFHLSWYQQGMGSSYQKNVLGYKNLDGEITAGKKMWKSLLGMI